MTKEIEAFSLNVQELYIRGKDVTLGLSADPAEINAIKQDVADLEQALQSYTKFTDLAGYVKTSALSAYAQLSTLDIYAKISDLATYAKQSDLAQYVTNTGFTTRLNSYVTRSSLDTDLGNYAKNSQLIDYVKKSELESIKATPSTAVSGSWNGFRANQTGNTTMPNVFGLCDGTRTTIQILGVIDPSFFVKQGSGPISFKLPTGWVPSRSAAAASSAGGLYMIKRSDGSYGLSTWTISTDNGGTIYLWDGLNGNYPDGSRFSIQSFTATWLV